MNGKDAYKVIVEKAGMKTNEYFSVEDGLKVKTENPVAGEIEYLEYKEFAGIRMPSVLSEKSPQLPTALRMTMTSIEVNPTLSAEELK